MLQIKNLSITHKKDLRVILNDFSCVLNDGDKAVIIGEEGNGKSTLLKWIYDEKLVDDYCETEGELVKTKERIAYLPQELPKEKRTLSVCEFFMEEESFLEQTPKTLGQMAAKFHVPADFFYREQLALGAMMMLSLLTGCGSKTEDSAPADSTPAEETPAEPAAAASLLEKVKTSGKLVVGTEAQYAPYEFKDLNANFAGCDMWLAQQIADHLGVELEVVDMSFDGIIPAVKSGQVDLGIAAFTKTPERAEEIDFSDLYEKSAQLLIVKAGNADLYSTKESLAGQKVGAQKGTIQSQLIQTALPDSELFELEKYPALALEVQNGNIAGLVVDQAVGESLIATSNGGLEVSNFAFTSEEASFGKAVVAAKGSEDLLAEVNTVINQVVNDGSYLKAYDEAVELAASMGL